MKNWENYLNKEIQCECGRTYKCDIAHIVVAENAILELPKFIKEAGYQNIWLVSDANIEKAVGKKVYDILEAEKLEYHKIIFEDKELIPDERAIGTIVSGLSEKCDLLIGVGSGTINDLCKLVSFKLRIDYFIVASAPSMDGYASNVAPLIIKNMKTTYEVGRPKVILGDINILSEAPASLISAGVGDMLGKYVCLADWELSHIITGEYYCEYVKQIMGEALDCIVKVIDKIESKDKQAVASVMEGLILAGIAMSYLGNSRPASGSEHHLSHFWEMMFLQKGTHGAWHGTKVGVGTVICLTIYQSLNDYLKNISNLPSAAFNQEDWSRRIQEVYGITAPEVILLEEKAHKNSDENVNRRMLQIKCAVERILTIVEKLPSAETVKQYLKTIHAPYLPEQIDVDQQMLTNSIVFAKEIRNRYGLLQFLFDIQMLETVSKSIGKQLKDVDE